MEAQRLAVVLIRNTLSGMHSHAACRTHVSGFLRWRGFSHKTTRKGEIL
jgi:hypothetical protein